MLLGKMTSSMVLVTITLVFLTRVARTSDVARQVNPRAQTILKTMNDPECKDYMEELMCKLVLKNGFCTSSELGKFMRAKCRKTCGHCSPTGMNVVTATSDEQKKKKRVNPKKGPSTIKQIITEVDMKSKSTLPAPRKPVKTTGQQPEIIAKTTSQPPELTAKTTSQTPENIAKTASKPPAKIAKTTSSTSNKIADPSSLPPKTIVDSTSLPPRKVDNPSSLSSKKNTDPSSLQPKNVFNPSNLPRHRTKKKTDSPNVSEMIGSLNAPRSQRRTKRSPKGKVRTDTIVRGSGNPGAAAAGIELGNVIITGNVYNPFKSMKPKTDPTRICISNHVDDEGKGFVEKEYTADLIVVQRVKNVKTLVDCAYQMSWIHKSEEIDAILLTKPNKAKHSCVGFKRLSGKTHRMNNKFLLANKQAVHMKTINTCPQEWDSPKCGKELGRGIFQKQEGVRTGFADKACMCHNMCRDERRFGIYGSDVIAWTWDSKSGECNCVTQARKNPRGQYKLVKNKGTKKWLSGLLDIGNI